MKEIPLSNGGVALVDDEDYEWLNQWKWRSDYKGYARRMVYIGYVNGRAKLREVKMHRQIMGDVKGEQYDHINTVKLDNRRSNLRAATNQQNMWNRGRQGGTEHTSRFKGVMWKKSHKQWAAKLKHLGRYVWIGLFYNEEVAAMAYDEKVRELRGPWARLNFPRNGEQSAVA